MNNSCVACHKINERSVGPAFREVATRYEKVSKTIIDKLSIKIQNGSIDSWGKIPMPPNLLLSKEERVSIIKFILLTKYKS